MGIVISPRLPTALATILVFNSEQTNNQMHNYVDFV